MGKATDKLTKSVLVELTLREGDREFSLKPFTATVEAKSSNDDIADKIIREFYGKPTEINEKGWYFYENSEYAIYLTQVKDIPTKDFNIVSKYL